MQIGTLFECVKPVGVAGELDFPGGDDVDSADRQRRREGELVHGAVCQQRIAVKVIGRGVTADANRIETEIICAVGSNLWQRRKNLSVGENRAADAGFAGAMDEKNLVGHAAGQRLAVIVGIIKIVVRVKKRGVNGRAVTAVGKIIEFKQVRRNAVGAGKIVAGGAGKIAQADGQFKISGYVDIRQIQVKQDAKAVGFRECRAERMVKITVRLRRIPSDGESLIRGIPLEQICVAKNLPAIERRIFSEIFNEAGCAGGHGKQNKQAGQRQRNQRCLFHELIFQSCPAKKCGTGFG